MTSITPTKKWRLLPISEIAENLDSKRIPIEKGKRKQGDIPYYGATGIIDYVDDYIFDEEILLIGEDGADWSAYANTAFIARGKSWVNNHAHVLRVRNNTNTNYLKEIINFLDLDKYTSGTTRKKLTKSDLMSLKIPIPSMEVQNKISSILVENEKSIFITQKTIDQNEQLKKALMQQLFTQGIGHTKFKQTEIGEVPESWVVTLLDNVAKRGTGHTPNKKNPNYYNGGVKWVSLTDSNKLDKGVITKTSKEISSEGIKNSSAVLHEAGTVILSRDAGVGKSAILGSNMAVSQHFIAWKCGSRLNNWFLYYYLQYKKPVFENIASGSTIKTIGMPFFKQMPMIVPDIKEQEKVAQILKTIDGQIDVNKKLKAKQEQLKQGLMQDLLTGKVAV